MSKSNSGRGSSGENCRSNWRSRVLEDSKLFRYYLWKYRRWVGIGIIALVVVDVIDVFPPILLKKVVDIAVDKKPPFLLAWVALGYFGIAFVQAICRYAWRMYLIRSSIYAGRDLRGEYAQHLFGLSPSFFDRSPLGDLMTLATSDVEAVRSAIGTGVLLLADALIYLLTVPVAMLLLSPKLTLLVCIPLPLVPWIVLRNEKSVHERFEQVQQCFGKIAAVTQENLNGIRVVKAFAREDSQIARMRAVSQEYVRLNLSLVRIQSALGPTLDFIMSFGMVVLLFWGGKAICHGDASALSLGTFVAFQRYIQKMVWPMTALGMAVNYYQKAVSSSRRLGSIFATRSDVPSPGQPEVPARPAGRIEFRNLSFSFPGFDRVVLKDVNLEIAPGERVAFVGKVGAGKSTLLSLIPRLYPIRDGMLFIDGIDINRCSLIELRKQVGYVSQDVFLFSDSVFENVAFGLHEWQNRPDLPEHIELATRLVSMHDEVSGLSSAYRTKLEERGANLSGGQKQRLTVARALAKQPSILVLDDALSSVDVQTEERILEGLRSRPGRNTELLAAHRISTVQSADRIVVLSQGRIVQVGDHKALIAQRSGEYWKFYERQRLKEDLEGYQHELRSTFDLGSPKI